MKILYKIMRNHKRQGVPALFLQIENEKYVFNVPETTQRFIREHGLRFSKETKFFFSGMTTSHLMGMIGLALTLFQHNLSQGSMIYGPKGICQFFRDLRYMMGIKLCHYSITDLENTEDTIPGINNDEYMLKLIESPDALKIFSDWETFCKSPQADSSKIVKGVGRVKSSQHIPPELAKKFGVTTYKDDFVEIIFLRLDSQSSVYIIIPEKIPGNFIPMKLLEKNIKGKLVGELSSKGKVTVTIGGQETTVKIEDVSEPHTPGPAMILVDSAENFDPTLLFDNPCLNYLFESPSEDKGYKLSEIVHFGSYDQIKKPEYQTWVAITLT